MGPRAQIVTCRSFIRKVVSQHVVRLEQIDRNRPASAFRASSSNEGKSGGRNPARLRLASWRSSGDRSDASVKPHHENSIQVTEKFPYLEAQAYSYPLFPLASS